MPKSNLNKIVQQQKRVKANYMCDLFRRYMSAKKITQTDLGKKMGITHSAVSIMLRRPVGEWRVKDIYTTAMELGCPTDELLTAILKSDGLDG